MPQQTTVGSYATATVAAGADAAWSPDERASTPNSVERPYGVDGGETADTPEQYTTFGCVEYRPRE
ncbi:hypothetical protein [Halobaculum rubrum]|uniref:hypothetical protein n=1 Tax=Halobaculum rubrum TaxID=2872158 RepID=UPI001CA3F6DF|nr:hypothetical protein [Halobaculum rubrum]QZX99063.1 hypothetical protein K6T25_12485 [Halobaculum rubrum]